eukprot:1887338-Pyramimonas_sp.AAC.1
MTLLDENRADSAVGTSRDYVSSRAGVEPVVGSIRLPATAEAAGVVPTLLCPPSCPQTLACTSTNEELLILNVLGRARADRALNEAERDANSRRQLPFVS